MTVMGSWAASDRLFLLHSCCRSACRLVRASSYKDPCSVRLCARVRARAGGQVGLSLRLSVSVSLRPWQPWYRKDAAAPKSAAACGHGPMAPPKLTMLGTTSGHQGKAKILGQCGFFGYSRYSRTIHTYVFTCGTLHCPVTCLAFACYTCTVLATCSLNGFYLV